MSQFAGERQHNQQVNSQLFNSLGPCWERGENPWRAIGRKDLDWVRLKCDGGSDGSQFTRALRGSAQQRLMGQVDAVKVADGDGASLGGRNEMIEVVNGLHGEKRSPTARHPESSGSSIFSPS